MIKKIGYSFLCLLMVVHFALPMNRRAQNINERLVQLYEGWKEIQGLSRQLQALPLPKDPRPVLSGSPIEFVRKITQVDASARLAVLTDDPITRARVTKILIEPTRVDHKAGESVQFGSKQDFDNVAKCTNLETLQIICYWVDFQGKKGKQINLDPSLLKEVFRLRHLKTLHLVGIHRYGIVQAMQALRLEELTIGAASFGKIDRWVERIFADWEKKDRLEKLTLIRFRSLSKEAIFLLPSSLKELVIGLSPHADTGGIALNFAEAFLSGILPRLTTVIFFMIPGHKLEGRRVSLMPEIKKKIYGMFVAIRLRVKEQLIEELRGQITEKDREIVRLQEENRGPTDDARRLEEDGAKKDEQIEQLHGRVHVLTEENNGFRLRPATVNFQEELLAPLLAQQEQENHNLIQLQQSFVDLEGRIGNLEEDDGFGGLLGEVNLGILGGESFESNTHFEQDI